MVPRHNRINEILGRLNKGFQRNVGYGREDYRSALKRAYEAEGKETDGSRWNQMMGSNPTVSVARELMGKANPEHMKARQEMGLGLSNDRVERGGQVLGTLAGDLVQDRGRSVWWLLNAPQAVGSTAQEAFLHKFAPDIYQAAPTGIGIRNTRDAKAAGLIGESGLPTAGVSRKGGEYYKRKYEPGLAEALLIPSGFAINQSIGLMNPLGGQEGYKAVLESEEDPSKTSNVLGEVAAKYILGKTGNLLPWDEFKQVRPDVSKDEYMRYKAFKFDNDGDLNPLDDGQMILPTGVAKYTNDGIHGAEVQFLGRSLPVNTGLLPTAAALAGTTIGARRGGIKGGLLGGIASTAGGMLAGNLFEQERRRRNAQENQIDTIN